MSDLKIDLNFDIEPQLERGKRMYDELDSEWENCIEQEVELFRKWAEKLQPVMNHIKTSRFMFTNPELKVSSSRGPVLARNRDNTNEVYIYDWRQKCIVLKSLYDDDKETTVSFHSYFEKYSFEEAMEAMLSVLSFWDDAVNVLKKDIKRRKENLSKYLLK